MPIHAQVSTSALVACDKITWVHGGLGTRLVAQEAIIYICVCMHVTILSMHVTADHSIVYTCTWF